MRAVGLCRNQIESLRPVELVDLKLAIQDRDIPAQKVHKDALARRVHRSQHRMLLLAAALNDMGHIGSLSAVTLVRIEFRAVGAERTFLEKGGWRPAEARGIIATSPWGVERR
jgi:hypothetical protein